MKTLKNKIVITLVSFFFFGNNLAVAQQASTVSDAVPMGGIKTTSEGRLPIDPKASSLDSALNPYNISIPERFGQVEEVFQGNANSPLVVHIQNVHANYEAQVNIKNILSHLVDQYQFSLIQLEGAVSKVDPAILQPSYLKEANLKLVDLLMREGRITGADAYAVETDKPVELYGIEDFSLYMENLKMFKTIYKHHEQLKPYFDEVHRLILSVGPKLLNPEQLDFTRKTEEFSTDKIDLLDYLVYMNKLAEKHKVISLNEISEMVDYPNLTRLMRLRNLEEELDKAGLKRETEAIKFEFQKKIPDSERVSELLSHLDDSAKGTNPRDYFMELTKMADEAKIDFVAYPAFRIFAEFLVHQDEIDHRALFSELKEFEQMLQDKLFSAEDERIYLSIIDKVGLLEQFFRLEMSREKIALYLEDRDSVKPSWIFTNLDALAKKRSVTVRPVGNAQILDSYMSEVEYFYQLVLKRDQVFIDKILAKTKSLALDKTIIVTGGFHKDGLVDHFRKEKISYVIINPKIDVKEGSQNYLKVMLEDDVVAGSVFAGTFALEKANSSLPSMEPDRAVIDAKGILATQLASTGPDFQVRVGEANVLLEAKNPSYTITDAAETGLSVSHRGEARFIDFFTGEGRRLVLTAEANRNDGIYSVRVIEDSPLTRAEVRRLGLTPPQVAVTPVSGVPSLDTIVSSRLPRTSVIADILMHSILAPKTTQQKPIAIGDDGDDEKRRIALLQRSAPSQLRLVDDSRSDDAELLAVPELEAILKQSSPRRTSLSVESITQGELKDNQANLLTFLNSQNTTGKPVFFVLSLSDTPAIAEAQAVALDQVLSRNAQNMAALVYGKTGTKEFIIKALSISDDVAAQESLFSRLIVVETGDKGVPLGSAQEAVTKMHEDVLAGGVFNHLRRAPFAKSIGLNEMLSNMGVLITMNAKGTQFSNDLVRSKEQIFQLQSPSEDSDILDGKLNEAISVYFEAIKMIAALVGVEATALTKQIDNAGLVDVMTNGGSWNQWAITAQGIQVLFEVHRAELRIQASA